MNIIQAQNPFFEKYSTPHGTIPFEKIKTEHYEPAIREGINRHNAEIDAITNNPEAATFANTVEVRRTVDPSQHCIRQPAECGNQR